MIREALELSIDSLRHRKISSALTVLGIVIGITAILSLMSIGEGLQYSVKEQLQAAGSDKIMVGAGSAGPMSALLGEAMKEDDIDMVEGVRGVERAIGMLYKSVLVKYKGESLINSVVGLIEDDMEDVFVMMKVLQIDTGRYMAPGENKVVVLGKVAATDLFEDDVGISDSIYIKGEKYKVIGILKSTANRQRDKAMYISLDELKKLTDTKDAITMIFAQAPDLSKIDKIAENIEEEFDDEYGEGFYEATTSQQIAESVGEIFALLSFVVGGIASIALVVAGVGIANTMFTSVMERTKEIGVMKAIGATNYNIMEIFLVEAALLGTIGGLIGSILGLLISQAITTAAAGALPIMFKAIVTIEMLVLSLLFSFLIGIISGLFPARRAAKLQPVEALRS